MRSRQFPVRPLFRCLNAALLATASLMAAAQAQDSSSMPLLSSTLLKRHAAPEADQGVASDADSFYAIDNSVIARYDRNSGERTGEWDGRAAGLIKHLNSCRSQGDQLLCANSNYPATPMSSSVERFDARTMQHAGSVSLGVMDEGSLTWVEPVAGGYIAGFAHYDEDRGAAYKDHRHSGIVRFDMEWRRTGGWAMPADVMERMAPHAASGGAIGPDGLLYVMGHDRPELYVLALPSMGPTLLHIATIAVDAEGQAFSWAPGARRILFAVDRHKGQVLEIQVPEVPVPEGAQRFRH